MHIPCFNKNDVFIFGAIKVENLNQINIQKIFNYIFSDKKLTKLIVDKEFSAGFIDIIQMKNLESSYLKTLRIKGLTKENKQRLFQGLSLNNKFGSIFDNIEMDKNKLLNIYLDLDKTRFIEILR